MSKSALLTLGRKLNGNDSFLLSVYDLEPSGITVSAYNQYNSKEYLLPITEMELASAGLTRHIKSLTKLLETIELISRNNTYILYSPIEGIGKTVSKQSIENLIETIKSPMENGSQSLHDLLVQGLVELCKAKPVGLDSIEWLGDWLLTNNPSKPKVTEAD